MLPKLKLVMLVVLLVWSATQCALACALEPCAEASRLPQPSGPPCHQHNESPGNQAPESPCPHRTVQADIPKTFTALPSIGNAVIDLAVASPLWSFFVSAEGLPFDVPSPRGLSLLSSVILRI
jgi:hypothetical protein